MFTKQFVHFEVPPHGNAGQLFTLELFKKPHDFGSFSKFPLSVFPRYTMPGNISQTFPKHFPKISQTFPKHFPNISQTLPCATLHALHSMRYTPRATLRAIFPVYKNPHFLFFHNLDFAVPPFRTPHALHSLRYTPRATLHALHSTHYTPRYSDAPT